jgi:hypothetical protein
MSKEKSGVSRKVFIFGIVVAIFLSSIISIIISTQLMNSPLGSSGFTLPDFDSGCISISPIETVEINHNLETSDVLVYAYGRTGTFVHQVALGGDTHQVENDNFQHHGLVWHGLTNQSLFVERGLDDLFWEEFRILIWAIS